MSDSSQEVRRFEGQVAVVTGGANGIGKAIAERLASDGADVLVLDVDEGAGRESGFRFERCDVSSEVEVGRAFARLEHVDILVSNAGINASFDAEEMSSNEWDSFMAVDLKAAWLCVRAAVALMPPSGGSVVMTSSVHAQMTTRGTFPYAAAKTGLIGMTRQLAIELADRAIRVNAVCPGYVRTRPFEEWLLRQSDPKGVERALLKTQPLGRFGRPEEIAALVAFLCSEDATFITGSSVAVDGGISCLKVGPRAEGVRE